jgi:hypothetical protein
MATTINNMMSGNINSSSMRNTQNQMNELRNQYRGNEINTDEYREQMAAIRERHEEARMNAAAIGADVASNVSNLFSYMNNSGGSQAGGTWGGGTFDQSVFFQSGSELSTLQTLNSARIGIENRARALVGEIARERAMGRDVSDRQEALSNLTGNLDILNRNLSNSIDRALSEDGGRREGNFIDVVGRIRESMRTPEPEETEEVAEPAQPPEEPAQSAQPPEEPAAEIPQEPAQEPAGFAAPPAFEGSVTEQVAEASQPQDYDEMSVAAQIANNANSDLAEARAVLGE